MADATTVIRELGQQIAQLTVDLTIAKVELAEAQARLAATESEQKSEG